jgi:transcriptional regulator with PAS, ATPase and Fis domain
VASFIGSSPAALEVKRQARRVAATDSTVLLQGETGTGKELLAQGIHAASSRAAGAFVGINIAAVPETLLEADFFGVAPGAYTGAERKGRDGKFRLADGGTLFLDEIGDMPLAMQAKLLRALQEQEIEPLGSNEVIKVDVRVIAATSRDLAAMVAEGRFREDLYYRLAVVPIRIPPLRERLGDFEALAEALLDDIERRTGLPHRSLAPEAIERLAGLPWRGNIRELRNVLERASMMTDDLRLGPAHFGALLKDPLVMPAKAGIQEGAGAQADEKTPGPGLRRDDDVTPLPQAIAELERNAIRAALTATGGNRMAAAKMLKISRAALYDKLALYPELAAGARG